MTGCLSQRDMTTLLEGSASPEQATFWRRHLRLCDSCATAMAQLRSPVTGLVAYHRRLGDWVHRGDLVATVIDPLGEETQLRAETDGRLFARHSQPYAWPGRVIGKIAGDVPLDGKEGNLLSD